MATRLLTSSDDLARYGAWLQTQTDAALWQSLAWKHFQEKLGRQTRVYVDERDGKIFGSALVVIDRTTGGLSTWDIPRGPLGTGDWGLGARDFMESIIQDAKKAGTMTVYFSPQFLVPSSESHCSNRHVMPEATRILDLTMTEDALLAQMKPKGRYNIGLATKHGVRVEHSGDIAAYAALATETARRDGFRGHTEAFYRHFLEDLPGSFLLLAYPGLRNSEKTPSDASQSPTSPGDGSTPIAGLLGVLWGTEGIYYYGASSSEHRELMAPYLLQWEAIRYCKTKGCTRYDFFGIAPEGKPDHPWSGVSEFKAKFGGTALPYPPEQELILRPGMKKLLQFKRKILG